MKGPMKFNRGTSEYMVVDVTEELGEITALVNATFDIYKSGDTELATPIVAASNNVIINGLRVRCLIAPGNSWSVGHYDLYLNLSGLPSLETPRLGPIEFIVEA